METTSKSGIQYIIKRKQFENQEMFYEKCWNITTQEPKTDEEYIKIYNKCQLKQNKIEFNCDYTK
jgi:hypothetical protein